MKRRASSETRLYRRNQLLLGYVLARKRRQHIFIHCVLRHDMVNGYSLLLPLPPEPRVCLLIKLKAPGQSKPNQDVSALLNVQAVAGGSGMNQGNGNTPFVPVLDVLGLFYIPGFISCCRKMRFLRRIFFIK